MPTLLLILLACSTPVQPVAVETEAPAAEPLPPIEHARRTNRAPLALENLDLRIQALHGRIADHPKERSALVDALGLRMALTGRTSDLDAMLAVGDGPSKAAALMATHHFDEALALDPSLADSVALARELELDRLETERRATAERLGDTPSWMRLGDVLLAKGDAEGADRAYASALAAYRDISPLTVADLQFRRGLAWGESGEDPARARALYQAAVKRLPGFVRAHVHLAELEMDAGEREAAIARVRKVSTAQDPEPGGKLAVWLEGEEAATWKAKTLQAYDRLLAAHPLAYADHAAEFFLAIDDRARAAELARINVQNRPTRRAHALCERAGCSDAEAGHRTQQ